MCKPFCTAAQWIPSDSKFSAGINYIEYIRDNYVKQLGPEFSLD